MRTYFPHEDCVPSQMTEIRMQPSLMKVRPQHETQSSPREPSPAAPPGHRPTRPLPTRTHTSPEDRPQGSPRPFHVRVRAVRSVSPPCAHIRPTEYAPGEVPTPTHQSAPPPSLLRSPRVGSLAPLRLPAPGGTSGPCWAASAGSLKAHRRPPGRPPWGSWTPRPIYGVCVTTPLPRCLNGVRDH